MYETREVGFDVEYLLEAARGHSAAPADEAPVKQTAVRGLLTDMAAAMESVRGDGMTLRRVVPTLRVPPDFVKVRVEVLSGRPEIA